ncbi:minor tail protein [Gordonia phage LuckyLeo]|nr:minor tail protein [Gordonia phage LuckyLeo]
MGWNDYESKQVRALRGISTRSEKPNKDLETNIRNLNNSVRYMSSMMGIMQEGIDDANRDIFQQFGDAIQDLMIIFNIGGGGDTLNLDWGDLGVVLKNISSIFRFDFFNLDLPDIDILGWAQDFWDNTFGNLDILNFERLKEAFNGEYVGPDIALNIIQNVIRTIKRLASGIIQPWRLPQVNVSSISNGPGPNLLSSFGGFNAAEDIAGDGIWFFDETVGKTSPGSASTMADGTLKVLSSEAIAVSAAQNLEIGGWVKWSGLTYTGTPFRLLVVPYIGSVAQTPVQIAALTSPSANGENTFPLVPWTVPASIDSVRVRVTVEAGVTTGTVWWDDLILRKAGTTLPQSFIGGLGQRLQDLDDNDTGLDDAIGKLASNINNAVTATIEDIGEGVGDILQAFNTIFNLNRQSKAAEAAALEAKQILAAMNNQEETGGDGMSWSTDFPQADGQPLPSGDWANVNNIKLYAAGGAGVVDSGSATPAWAATTRYTNTNSQKCSFIISRIHGAAQESGVFVRATANLSAGVICTVNEDGRVILARATISGGSISLGTTFLNTIPGGKFKVGDQVEVRCDGTYYYIYKNGTRILSYNDVANSVTLGPSNRYCGMYMEREQVNVIFMYSSPRFASFYMSDWYIPPGGPVNGFWQGNLTQYNALTTKLDSVAYFITP